MVPPESAKVCHGPPQILRIFDADLLSSGGLVIRSPNFGGHFMSAKAAGGSWRSPPEKIA